MIRIVKMTFRADSVDDFLQLFAEHNSLIVGMAGCQRVELARDLEEPSTFFTISHWESIDHLNRYRASELFEKVWGMTKPLFAAKPSAWSVELQET